MSESNGKFRLKLEDHTEFGDEFAVTYIGLCLRCEQPTGGTMRPKKKLFPNGIRDRDLVAAIFTRLDFRHKCGFTWTPWGYEINPYAKVSVPIINDGPLGGVATPRLGKLTRRPRPERETLH